MTLERKVVRSPAAQSVGGRHYEGKEMLLALANFETGGHLTNFLKEENRLHTSRSILSIEAACSNTIQGKRSTCNIMIEVPHQDNE